MVEQKERELVLKELAVDSVNGLSSHDVSERLELHGRNEFEESKRRRNSDVFVAA